MLVPVRPRRRLALLGAEQPDDAIAPRMYNDGTYWNLCPNESVVVGTWGWLTCTHIGVRVGSTLSGYPILYACVQFQAGFGAWTPLCSNTGESLSAYQFWGALLTIKNTSADVVMKVRTF